MQKKKILLILFVWIFLTAGGQTVFKLNEYNILYQGGWMPVFTMYGNYQITNTISASGYFYVNAYPKNSWGEGLAGINVTVVKGLTLGFLAGFQSNETEIWRISPLLMMSYGKFSFFGAFEFGGKRTRWDAMAFYSAGNFKLGGELIRYYQMYAAGPRAEFSFIKKQPVTIFYSFLWDWTYGHPAHMFGIYTSFGQISKNTSFDE